MCRLSSVRHLRCGTAKRWYRPHSFTTDCSSAEQEQRRLLLGLWNSSSLILVEICLARQRCYWCICLLDQNTVRTGAKWRRILPTFRKPGHGRQVEFDKTKNRNFFFCMKLQVRLLMVFLAKPPETEMSVSCPFWLRNYYFVISCPLETPIFLRAARGPALYPLVLDDLRRDPLLQGLPMQQR
jgi:hypothetical protein